MARPREFEMDKALDGAMNVFWANGYEQSTLPELLDGMGLTRGSFYKAFGDKKSVFLAIMERYGTVAVATAEDLLQNTEIQNGSDRIHRLFEMVIETVKNGDHRGCLLCSAAAGPASEDVEIGEITQRLLRRMQTGFEAAIEASDLSAQSDWVARENLAQLLLTQYIGLRILARSHAPLPTLQASVDALKRILV